MTEVIANITEVLMKAAGSQAAAKKDIDAAKKDITEAEDILKNVREQFFEFFFLNRIKILPFFYSSTKISKISETAKLANFHKIWQFSQA